MKAESLHWYRLCLICSEFKAGERLRAFMLKALIGPCLAVCFEHKAVNQFHVFISKVN